MGMVIQPVDISYFETSYFWVTTLLVLGAVAVYVWIKIRRRPRFPAWQD